MLSSRLRTAHSLPNIISVRNQKTAEMFPALSDFLSGHSSHFHPRLKRNPGRQEGEAQSGAAPIWSFKNRYGWWIGLSSFWGLFGALTQWPLPWVGVWWAISFHWFTPLMCVRNNFYYCSTWIPWASIPTEARLHVVLLFMPIRCENETKRKRPSFMEQMSLPAWDLSHLIYFLSRCICAPDAAKTSQWNWVFRTTPHRIMHS